MLTFICLWRAGGSVRHTGLGVFKNQSILHFEAERLFFPSWPSMRQDGYCTEQWLSPSFLSLLNGLRSLPLCSVQSTFTHQHHLPYGAPSSVFIYEHLFRTWMDVVPGMPLWAVMGQSSSRQVAGSPDGENHGSLVFHTQQRFSHQLLQDWWEMLGESHSTA